MATQKEIWQEQQRQIMERVDYFKMVLDQTKGHKNRKLIDDKMDELFDEYNELQRKIDSYE